jgi:ATP-dependent Clp protease ATP-binding subunit ClpA
LFVDELHTVVGAGSAEGSMDAATFENLHSLAESYKWVGATT